MPNRQNDPLFQLIKSLEKAEKRNFKLYVQRNSGSQDLKTVQLFDIIDKLSAYDDAAILSKNEQLAKGQLANLKAHLYKQILSSLRILRVNESIDMLLHEQLDHAKILYNKGLFLQSLKVLDKVIEIARENFQDNIEAQAVSLEKKIETLHITRSMQNRAQILAEEATTISKRRLNITRLSNLALLLYSWYIQHGHARNITEEKKLKTFFKDNMKDVDLTNTAFYENLYLYQCYTWYAFIRQDFLMYYRYTQKWVDLFEKEPKMISVETSHYTKGVHNLLNALFNLKYYKKNYDVLQHFQKFSESAVAKQDDNIKIQVFVYLNSAKMNRYISTGSFYKGVQLAPSFLKKLEEYELFVDEHRLLVLNYKIATIYFGFGDYEKCIDFLRKIINDKPGLRSDLQCYARLLHLIAHYELGNYEIIESLIKSVYRFMAKMQNLTRVEEEMFRFLRNSFHLNPRNLTVAFTKFYDIIKKFENTRFEARAYAYLDVHSWVESKIQNKTMAQVIKQKYLDSKRK